MLFEPESEEEQISVYEQVKEELREELHCPHFFVDLTRFIACNGATYFRLQCPRCGEFVKVVRKSTLNGRQLNNTKRLFDKKLLWERREQESKQISERCTKLYDERRAARDRAWFAWYDDYLDSPKWKARRKAVMERAHGICERCKVRPAAHVHHLSYENVGNEPLSDLMAVCLICHQREHPDKKMLNIDIDELE